MVGEVPEDHLLGSVSLELLRRRHDPSRVNPELGARRFNVTDHVSADGFTVTSCRIPTVTSRFLFP